MGQKHTGVCNTTITPSFMDCECLLHDRTCQKQMRRR